mmetsp:Transcript_8473/g.20878  ORF Transcript_8473/g.20878 Transcript_8473/m.20878 type:complete len:313 (+) Transcript_8473:1645-2583(+)
MSRIKVPFREHRRRMQKWKQRAFVRHINLGFDNLEEIRVIKVTILISRSFNLASSNEPGIPLSRNETTHHYFLVVGEDYLLGIIDIIHSSLLHDKELNLGARKIRNGECTNHLSFQILHAIDPVVVGSNQHGTSKHIQVIGTSSRLQSTYSRGNRLRSNLHANTRGEARVAVHKVHLVLIVHPIQQRIRRHFHLEVDGGIKPLAHTLIEVFLECQVVLAPSRLDAGGSVNPHVIRFLLEQGVELALSHGAIQLSLGEMILQVLECPFFLSLLVGHDAAGQGRAQQQQQWNHVVPTRCSLLVPLHDLCRPESR